MDGSSVEFDRGLVRLPMLGKNAVAVEALLGRACALISEVRLSWVVVDL